MRQFSFYNSPITNLKPSREIILIELFELIKKNEFIRDKTIYYRSNEIDKNKKDEFKKTQFNYITVSGTFYKRLANGIKDYSGYCCIDCDSLTKEELHTIIEFSKLDKHILLSFTSPNEGYKIIIRTGSVLNHKNVFNAFRNYLSISTGIDFVKFDSSGSDISRACFICHDPNVYLNVLVSQNRERDIPIIEWEKYNLNNTTNVEDSLPQNNIVEENNEITKGFSLDYSNKNLEINFKTLIEMMEGKRGKYGSPREPWIQILASYCNQFGMSGDITLELMLKYFANHPESIRPDKPITVEKYIIAPVKDVYKRYADQHSTWEENEPEKIIQTPTIPNSIYHALPKFFKKILLMYKDDRERDIVFLSMLGVLSTCFPNYYGLYDNKRVCANLFIFIIAPASSGKGAALATRNLGHALQKSFDVKFAEEMQAYQIEMKEYKQNLKDGEETAEPIKPVKKILFIPANITSPKLIETLSRNKKFGIILDSEADTLTQSLKTQHGNFSDIIRKVFHHEPIELQRKMNDEYTSLTKSYLSLVLTGTPDQVNKLLHNVENGFFSRFIFYHFPLKREWKNVFEKTKDLPEDWFISMSVELLQFIEKTKLFEDIDEEDEDKIQKIRFKLLDNQEQSFNNWFDKKEKELYETYGDEIIPA